MEDAGQDAGGRGPDFDVNLVRLQFDDDVAHLDRLPLGHAPLADGRLDHRFAQLGNHDLCAHWLNAS
jgi:hypothetical protein